MRAKIIGVAQVTLVAAVVATWSVGAQEPVTSQVTGQDLRDGLKNPTRWLTNAGDYGNHRHSPLTQITPENVHRLTAQWAFQTETLGKFEAAPLVLDGVVYVTGPLDTGWALDARTGRQIWRYKRDLPSGLIACCGLVNRGFGVLGDRLFKTTLDAHVVAISRKTGTLQWDTVMENFQNGYSATAAPLVVKDEVIVGMAGAEYGVRGFVDAYDVQTGKQRWRFYTTAGPGDPGHSTWRGMDPKAWEHGGGSTWVTGAYDPELNLVFWGTGNAGPDYNGTEREGDNLYTASVVALDADSGRLRWHYQFTPHDVWDWDSTQMPVLADLTLGGQLRKVVLFANRNGFFYVLDRATGTLIRGKPFIETSWAKEIRADGRPMLLPNIIPSEEGTKVCPDQSGGTNWMSPSFDPSLGLFFVTARESCGVFYSWKDDYNPGDAFRGGAVQRLVERQYSALRAIDVATGERRWEFPYASQSWAGVLSTAAHLVFAGASGNFMAFDARTGKNLWHFQTGSALYAGAITYMVDGRQYVLMPSGTTLTAFALADFHD
ncbi:MAG TPA: PQQ-dependent dehydrogenase, methanol/ethanol family [Vicinamibacterales bacterium]|nr:PQQ-dependent dehydrogenase, methanol/ethanol family [Vicinamibacterales bacterium]